MINLKERIELIEEFLGQELEDFKYEKSKKDMVDRTTQPKQCFERTFKRVLTRSTDGTINYEEIEI